MKINLASLLESKGINAEEIDAKRLVIETNDGRVIYAEEPSIAKTRFFGMDVLLVLADLDEGKKEKQEQANSSK
ncbi:MAG: hypothetical protein MPF33_02270 [Candidatus Aramenus sp.]|nr:hypothetical protein [Candidatus Aramenus sp.]